MAGTSSPEAVTGVKAVQVPSGVGVLPVRTWISMSVPGGVSSLQLRAPQSAWLPASKTREVNVHGDV